MVKKYEEEKRPDPLVPFLGFIIILILGGVSWVVSPAVVAWLARTNWVFGTFGWQVLPIHFPENWPPLLSQALIALLIFLLLFTIAMAFFFLFARPPEAEYGELGEYLREPTRRRSGKRGRRRR